MNWAVFWLVMAVFAFGVRLGMDWADYDFHRWVERMKKRQKQ